MALPINPVIAIIEEGHSGVALFIVLSGFILSIGSIDHTVRYKSFLIARILRIYPMLLLCLVVAYNVSGADLIGLVTTALPLPPRVGTSFTSMFWAVAVEFQCYLVFPFLIAFSNARGTKFLWQVIAVALVMRMLAVLADGASPRDISTGRSLGGSISSVSV